MNEKRISSKTVINSDYWADKTQKQFTKYFSDRVKEEDLVNHYKSFSKKKVSKKVNNEPIDDINISDS